MVTSPHAISLTQITLYSETIFVSLYNLFIMAMDRHQVFCLRLLHISVVFDTMGHAIFIKFLVSVF